MTTTERRASLLDAEGRTERLEPPSKAYLFIVSAMAAVCREAGASVKTEVRLRDLNVQVPATDARRVDVLAGHLPCRQGRQLAIDVTRRSPLTTQVARPRRQGRPSLGRRAAFRDLP